MTQNSKQPLLILLGLVVLCLAYIFLSKSDDLRSSESVNDYLRVHFIDVGQGDATLLQGPDFTILIDAGRHDRDDVVPYMLNSPHKNCD